MSGKQTKILHKSKAPCYLMMIQYDGRFVVGLSSFPFLFQFGNQAFSVLSSTHFWASSISLLAHDCVLSSLSLSHFTPCYLLLLKVKDGEWGGGLCPHHGLSLDQETPKILMSMYQLGAGWERFPI